MRRKEWMARIQYSLSQSLSLSLINKGYTGFVSSKLAKRKGKTNTSDNEQAIMGQLRPPFYFSTQDF
jgi:lipocalin